MKNAYICIANALSVSSMNSDFNTPPSEADLFMYEICGMKYRCLSSFTWKFKTGRKRILTGRKKQFRNLDINPHKSVIKHFKCKCQRAGSKFTRHIHYRFTTAESQVLKFPHATLKQQKADGAETQTNLNHRLHFTSLQQFRVYTIKLFYCNFCNCTKTGDISPLSLVFMCMYVCVSIPQKLQTLNVLKSTTFKTKCSK